MDASSEYEEVSISGVGGVGADDGDARDLRCIRLEGGAFCSLALVVAGTAAVEGR